LELTTDEHAGAVTVVGAGIVIVPTGIAAVGGDGGPTAAVGCTWPLRRTARLLICVLQALHVALTRHGIGGVLASE
jgi:hypothetical protein